MARLKQLNPTPDVDFPGRDESILALHDILRSVHFNFEYEAEEGEVLDDDLLMDLTMQDMARQVINHPSFLSVCTAYGPGPAMARGFLDPELVAFEQRLNGTYKEKEYKEEEATSCCGSKTVLHYCGRPINELPREELEEAFAQFFSDYTDLNKEVSHRRMQEAHDLHLAQQAAQDDYCWGL